MQLRMGQKRRPPMVINDPEQRLKIDTTNNKGYSIIEIFIFKKMDDQK